MSLPRAHIALCSQIPFAASGGNVPEWIHLLPAGEITTVDGRGPYRVANMAAVMATSLKPGQKLPLDENHAIDRAEIMGNPAPARGWIIELQARDNGLWGRVDWTGYGRKVMEDRAYSGISPVILHTVDNEVMQVLRASLTNAPNMVGLTALHSQQGGGQYRKPLDAMDRKIMSLFQVDEESYREGLAKVGLEQQTMSVSSRLSADDRLLMSSFGMNEDEYRAMMAKGGIVIGG